MTSLFPEVEHEPFATQWLEACQASSWTAHLNARRSVRRCGTRRRLILMFFHNMSVVLACEKGGCTGPSHGFSVGLHQLFLLYAADSATNGQIADLRRFERSHPTSAASTATKVPSTTSSAPGGRESRDHDLAGTLRPTRSPRTDARCIRRAPPQQETVLPSSP